jgi:hypothetical protein
MGIIEPHEPPSVWVMQGQSVAQPMRPLRRWLGAFELEFQPIALVEVVDAAIKRQQEFKCMLVRNSVLSYISCHDSIHLIEDNRQSCSGEL